MACGKTENNRLFSAQLAIYLTLCVITTQTKKYTTFENPYKETGLLSPDLCHILLNQQKIDKNENKSVWEQRLDT